MAQPEPASEPPPAPQPLSPPTKHGFLRKLFGRVSENSLPNPADPLPDRPIDNSDSPKPGSINRLSRKVVAGLPRAQTFRRQQSEQRVHLAPVEPDPQERRTASVDRRSRGPRRRAGSQVYGNPRVSAPGFIHTSQQDATVHHGYQPIQVPIENVQEVEGQHEHQGLSAEGDEIIDEYPLQDAHSAADARSITTSQYEALLHDELECTWILNLSMHFRDRSKREKFFVTYRESDHVWRRVTISLDYRNAPPNSLEMDLVHTEFQRDKSAKIYEAIRESLPEIQFYDTVTNLKLQTTDGRLHVHVVEDGNEIISYPPVHQIQYLGCRRIRERDINFEAHMSGFVYRVNVDGQVLIKKEIPSPETIDEFLYEVNALYSLRFSDNVVKFYGVVVDDDDERIKGLLISYAEQGALVDIIYDHCKDDGHGLPWPIRERWARQIVQGLADIHESGFVQGDFTLSNIVIDAANNAKIIDINRRGCPVGWEPPEAAPLIESNQRISMYIGVKSDLFQLGMVLWGLAMEEDEPELQGRPLILGPEVGVPDWYRQITEICLSYDPRLRLQASALVDKFPLEADGSDSRHDSKLDHTSISVDDGYSLRNYLVDGYHADGHPQIKTVEPPNEWSYTKRRYASPSPYQPYYHTRGRSPPSPLPSNIDRSESPQGYRGRTTWAANINIAPSYSDVGADDLPPYGFSRQPTPTPTVDKMPLGFVETLDGQQPTPEDIKEDAMQVADADSWDVETPKGEAVPLNSKADGIEPDVVRVEAAETQAASGDAEPTSQPVENVVVGTEEVVTQDISVPEPATGGPDLAAVAQFIADAKKQDESVAETLAETQAEAEGFYISGSTELEGNTAPHTHEVAKPATAQTTESGSLEKEIHNINTTGTESDPPADLTADTSVPRTVDIPDSLTGVGSGHALDEVEMREAGLLHDAEFTVGMQPNVQSKVTNTTDSKN